MIRMKYLISPSEVIALTSGENLELDARKITMQVIMVAQRRYIQPALGKDLYSAINEGKYNSFVDNYIKPTLALYIARSLIYNHTVRIGAGGVAIPLPLNHVRPSQKELAEVMNTLKKGAETMLKIAIEHIVESKLFPEFSIIDSSSRTSTLGGIIV